MNGIDLSETPQTTCLDIPEDLALFIASYLGGETLARLEATPQSVQFALRQRGGVEACVRARWHDPRWLDVPIDCSSAATNVQVLDSARRARRSEQEAARHAQAVRRKLLERGLPRAAPPRTRRRGRG